MKLWSKTRDEQLWQHDYWRIWSVHDDFGPWNRKYEIHSWVLSDGWQVITVRSSRKAIFRVANRLVRGEKS